MCLDANKLKSIEFTEEMPSLEVISCRENSLEKINGIVNLKNLKELYADGNEFVKIDEEWGCLENLNLLSIKYNSITSFPALQNLQILDVSHNNLPAIEYLPECLTELYISHNCLTELPALPSILTIDISHNKVNSLHFLSSSNNLKLLNASHNELEDPIQVLSDLKPCSELVLLDIKGCPFKPQHRLMFISAFVGTLQEINGLAVAPEERKKAIEEQEISFDVTPNSFKYHHSAKSSQDNFTLSPSPGGS